MHFEPREITGDPLRPLSDRQRAARRLNVLNSSAISFAQNMVHDAEDGADDEVPLVIETDENEAQTHVDPPHLDGLDAHHGHDSADEWGWGETIVLVPWTAVGTIIIDGYHVPRIRRSLGLL